MMGGETVQRGYFEEFRESEQGGEIGLLAAVAALSGIRSSPFMNPYPLQKGGSTPIKGCAGELRGYYRRSDGSDRWKPSWSKFDHARSGVTHRGVDIYAPIGTEVVAIADGYAMLYSDPAPGDDLGVKIGITLSGSDGKKYDVLYGHLSAVEGESRQVKKGDLIGRTGCTGNAEDGACEKSNSCNGSSSHVHIAVRENKSGASYVDPVALFGWVLDYAKDNRDVPCLEAFG